MLSAAVGSRSFRAMVTVTGWSPPRSMNDPRSTGLGVSTERMGVPAMPALVPSSPSATAATLVLRNEKTISVSSKSIVQTIAPAMNGAAGLQIRLGTEADRPRPVTGLGARQRIRKKGPSLRLGAAIVAASRSLSMGVNPFHTGVLGPVAIGFEL